MSPSKQNSDGKSDRVTISFRRPSSNPPVHPIDLVADEQSADDVSGVVSAFVVLPDGSRNSLGMFTPDTTIAELLRRAKRVDL